MAKKRRNRTVLIDGDTVIFAAAMSAEHEVRWTEQVHTLHTNMREAEHFVRSSIERIQDDLGAANVVVALSDYEMTRFRQQWNPDYKSNRQGSRKPLGYAALQDFVRDNYYTYEKPTLEGDDVLGILATHPKIIPGEKVIAAIDKDMLTIPGLFYNYDRKTLTEITEEDADFFFFQQALAGDATDGYPGCPGVGMARAEEYLAAGKVFEPYTHTFTRGERKGETEIRWQHGRDAESLWEIVVSVYASKNLGEEVALLNARMARILRWTDYDYEKQRPIPWSP
jgi:5'-3' exonuclease